MAAFSDNARNYYWLTKPGIIYGNALTTIAGFLFASGRHIDLVRFVTVLVASSLVIASGCVFNNYLDRKIDVKMARTSKRALVTKTIPVRDALIFASALGLVGFILLIAAINWLTFVVGLVGFIDYVIFYGIAKRRSVHGTLVGTIAGSTPILAGYTAAVNHLDWTAWILFFILVAWQMAHFYAIAIYRLKDYRNAGLPVWPVKKGISSTKKQIFIYILTFAVLSLILKFVAHASYIYLIIMIIVSLAWLSKGIKGYDSSNTIAWGKRVFLFSLITILVFSIALSVNAWLPT